MFNSAQVVFLSLLNYMSFKFVIQNLCFSFLFIISLSLPFPTCYLSSPSLLSFCSSLPSSCLLSPFPPLLDQDDDTSLPSPSIAMDKEGKLTVKVPDDVPDPELILTPRGSLSAPTSACPSPVPRSRCLGKYVPVLFFF